MTSSPTHTLRAIVLKKQNLPSRDVVFTVFAEGLGKLRVYGKNIKSVTSRRIAHLQTGNLVMMQIRTRGETNYIEETSLQSAFGSVKGDIRLLRSAYLVLYVLDRLLPEREAEDRIFALLLRYCADLSRRPEMVDELSERALNDIVGTLGYLRNPLPINLLIREIEAVIGEKIPADII